MRSYFATLRQLVLPAGGGPNTARIVLGPDLPPPLNTYGFGIPSAVAVGGITFNPTDPTSFEYLVFVQNNATIFSVYLGQVTNGVVLERTAGQPLGTQWLVSSLANTATQVINVSPAAAMRINGNAIAYGTNGNSAFQSIVANSAAFAVETTVFNIFGFFDSGRAYEIEIDGLVRPGGGATGAEFRLRRGTIAGGAYVSGLTKGFTALGDERFLMKGRLKNPSGGVTISQNIAVTIQPSGGIGTVMQLASASNVFSAVLRDIGTATDYPNVNAVV